MNSLLKLTLSAVCLITIFQVPPGYGADSVVCADQGKLENALLTENWDKAATLCSDRQTWAKSPVLRGIKGHAYLALNRNDDSLELFLSLANETDRATWRQWSSEFADQNSSSGVALYLKGDALARSGEWKQAIEIYTKALDKAKSNIVKAMVLNGRGVAYASQPDVSEEDLKNATTDFEKAIALAPNFADAYASLGTVLIRRAVAEGALESFEKALQYSKGSALAVNGRGCARYGLTDPDSVTAAIDDFKVAMATHSPAIKKLVEKNIQEIVETSLESLESIPDETVSTSEGMTVKFDAKKELNKIAGMTPSEQKSAIQNFDSNQMSQLKDLWDKNLNHSRKSQAVIKMLPGEWANKADTLVNATGGVNKWEKLGPLFNQEKQGGATTANIQRVHLDKGNWPVKTWFGLAQQADITD